MDHPHLAFGVDIGGTKILTALVDVSSGKVIAHRTVPTRVEAGPVSITKEIAQIIQELKKAPEVAAQLHRQPLPVGFAVAGQIDGVNGCVRFAPNLAWRNFPLRQQFQESLQAPIYVTNDVRAAAWGEWIYGAGRGCQDAVYLFFGTGIGGAIVSAGKMLTGTSNAAGELGHIVIDRTGPLCTCGNRGCFEALAGGWAIARDLKAAVKAQPAEGKFLLGVVDGKLEELTAKRLFEGYSARDPLSVWFLDEWVDIVSAAVSGLVNAFNPKKLIFGGGIIAGAPFMVPKIKEEIQKRALAAAVEPLEVVRSLLGAEAGAIGAAVFAVNN